MAIAGEEKVIIFIQAQGNPSFSLSAAVNMTQSDRKLAVATFKFIF